MNSNDIRRDPERWAALQELIKAEVSLNEIRRTLGVDHRTVKRHFPEYKVFQKGWSSEGQELARASRKLNALERSDRDYWSNTDFSFLETGKKLSDLKRDEFEKKNYSSYTHGTSAMYGFGGCRCPHCTEGVRIRQAELRNNPDLYRYNRDEDREFKNSRGQ